MLVTEGGKNIYPADSEECIRWFAVKDTDIFATELHRHKESVWREELVMAMRLEPGAEMDQYVEEELAARNGGCRTSNASMDILSSPSEFPRTAS